MIIVGGWLRVEPGDRDAYLASCRDVVAAARRAPGCVDFCVSADLIDPGRINVFEQWDSAAAVEAFRGSGPDDGQQSMIVGAQVVQHDVASSTALELNPARTGAHRILQLGPLRPMGATWPPTTSKRCNRAGPTQTPTPGRHTRRRIVRDVGGARS